MKRELPAPSDLRSCGNRQISTDIGNAISNQLNSVQNMKSMTIATVGIDLEKNVVVMHGFDATGKPGLVHPSAPRRIPTRP
jgi:hypothetical protein